MRSPGRNRSGRSPLQSVKARNAAPYTCAKGTLWVTGRAMPALRK